MTTRERIIQLVEALPDELTDEALARIADLAEPDDGRLTPEEWAGLDEAEAAIAAGDERPLAEVLRDLER